MGCVSGPIDSESGPDANEPKTEQLTLDPINKKKGTKPTKIVNLRSPTKPKTLQIKSLVGRDSKNIQKLFGMPSFVRKDLGTQFWRYEGEDCRLSIAMYPKGRNTDYRVVYTETSDKNGLALDQTSCLQKLFLKVQNFMD